MMHPVQAYHHKAYKKANKFRDELQQAINKHFIGCLLMVVKFRNLHFDDKQGDSNSKNGVTKKSDPFYLEFLFKVVV